MRFDQSLEGNQSEINLLCDEIASLQQQISEAEVRLRAKRKFEDKKTAVLTTATSDFESNEFVNEDALRVQEYATMDELSQHEAAMLKEVVQLI